MYTIYMYMYHIMYNTCMHMYMRMYLVPVPAWIQLALVIGLVSL